MVHTIPGILPVSLLPLLTCSCSITMTPIINYSTEDRWDQHTCNFLFVMNEEIHLTVLIFFLLYLLSTFFFVDGHTIPFGGNCLGMCPLYVNSKNSGYAKTVFVAEASGKIKQSALTVTQYTFIIDLNRLPHYVSLCYRVHRTLEESGWAMGPLRMRLKSSSMTSSHSNLRMNLR